MNLSTFELVCGVQLYGYRVIPVGMSETNGSPASTNELYCQVEKIPDMLLSWDSRAGQVLLQRGPLKTLATMVVLM
jgi:hypothetical protein